MAAEGCQQLKLPEYLQTLGHQEYVGFCFEQNFD